MGESYEDTPVQPDRLEGATNELANELARIVVRHSGLIMQLTVNQKAITPLLTIKLQAIMVDCISEVMTALQK